MTKCPKYIIISKNRRVSIKFFSRTKSHLQTITQEKKWETEFLDALVFYHQKKVIKKVSFFLDVNEDNKESSSKIIEIKDEGKTYAFKTEEGIFNFEKSWSIIESVNIFNWYFSNENFNVEGYILKNVPDKSNRYRIL